MSDTLRDRVVTYMRDVALSPGWMVRPDEIERALSVPWSEIRSALDALCSEPEPLFRKSVHVVVPDPFYGEERIEISDEDLVEAEETGKFYHPESGVEIEGWREKVRVTYLTTKALRTVADDIAERLAQLEKDVESRLRETEWHLSYSPPVPPELVESLVKTVREYMETKEDA